MRIIDIPRYLYYIIYMYSYIIGTIADMEEGKVVLDNHGIGYVLYAVKSRGGGQADKAVHTPGGDR